MVRTFTTVSSMEILETTPTSATAAMHLHEGYEHSALDCDYARGLATTVPQIFGLAAGTILLGEAVQLSLGLPGAAGLGRLGVVESTLAVGSAALVLVLLLVDAARRRPEPAPDQPYAL